MRKGMQPLQSARNIATIAKRGKHVTGNKQMKSAKSTTRRKRSKESL